MPGMQERIDVERARLEHEKQRQAQEEQARIAKLRVEGEQYTARVKADERYQLLLKTAHDPLLIEALEAYFLHFPDVKRERVEESLFGIYIRSKTQEVLHRFRHSIDIAVNGLTTCNVPATVAVVRVNGVSITWDETGNNLRFYVCIQVNTDYSSNDFIVMQSVEELASFIARSIVENRPIVGLCADQPYTGDAYI